MPWLSTPCRSAQERMSAVASALSSGMPQANRMASSCARCFSYGAGMAFPILLDVIRLRSQADRCAGRGSSVGVEDHLILGNLLLDRSRLRGIGMVGVGSGR